VKLHPGMSMHKVPVEGLAGLIFALGIVAIFLLGLPWFLPIAALSATGGLLLAPLFRMSDRVRSVAGFLVMAAVMSLFIMEAPVLRSLIATSVFAGLLFAPLLRFAWTRPRVSVRLRSEKP